MVHAITASLLSIYSAKIKVSITNNNLNFNFCMKMSVFLYTVTYITKFPNKDSIAHLKFVGSHDTSSVTHEFLFFCCAMTFDDLMCLCIVLIS